MLYKSHLATAALIVLTITLAALPSAATEISGPVGPAFIFTADEDLRVGPQRNLGELCGWRSDGSEEGTWPLPGCAKPVSTDARLGQRMLLRSYRPGGMTHLWVSDGTLEGTVALAGFRGAERFVREVTEVRTADGPRLVFILETLDREREPWVSDGTTEGTHPLAEGTAVPKDAFLTGFTAVGETDQALVFLAEESDGPEDRWAVWRSDLTPGGTRELHRFPALPGNPRPLLPLVAVGDAVLLWFEPADLQLCAPCVAELWSVGAPDRPARRIATQGLPPGQNFFLNRIEAGGDHAYFGLTDQEGDPQTWRSDGYSAEEVRTADGESLGPLLSPAVTLGEDLVMTTPSDLWRVPANDPQAAVRLCSDRCTPGRLIPGAVPTPQGDAVALFDAFSQRHTQELWVTDGTPEGTRMVRDFCTGRCDSNPFILARGSDGRLLVAVTLVSRERGVYLVDVGAGTTEELVKGVFPGRSGAALDGTFYFTDLSAYGPDLWRTDGTSAGTRRFLELSPTPGSSEEAPAVPRLQGVQKDGFDGSNFLLYWQDGLDGGAVQDFIVERRSPTAPGWTTVEVQPAETFGSHRHFIQQEPGTPATYRVRARNEAATSPPSEEVSYRTPQYPPTRTQCDPATQVCLGGGRYGIQVDYRDHHSSPMRVGTGTPSPDIGSERSGVLSFFAPDNVELVVKMIDGADLNGYRWLFYGATTDLEFWLTATDHETGQARTYRNPPGEICGLADTVAMRGGGDGSLVAGVEIAAPPNAGTDGACVPDDQTLCLLGGRYAVSVEWHDQHNGKTGTGGTIPYADRSGFFWFFKPDNVELVVKILDGTPVNGKTWVFYGALTDVGYTLTVTDTANGNAVERYVNEPGNVCGGADTDAF